MIHGEKYRQSQTQHSNRHPVRQHHRNIGVKSLQLENKDQVVERELANDQHKQEHDRLP